MNEDDRNYFMRDHYLSMENQNFFISLYKSCRRCGEFNNRTIVTYYCANHNKLNSYILCDECNNYIKDKIKCVYCYHEIYINIDKKTMYTIMKKLYIIMHKTSWTPFTDRYRRESYKQMYKKCLECSSNNIEYTHRHNCDNSILHSTEFYLCEKCDHNLYKYNNNCIDDRLCYPCYDLNQKKYIKSMELLEDLLPYDTVKFIESFLIYNYLNT